MDKIRKATTLVCSQISPYPERDVFVKSNILNLNDLANRLGLEVEIVEEPFLHYNSEDSRQLSKEKQAPKVLNIEELTKQLGL